MKTPRAPDPVATAQAQAGLNESTALTQQLVNQTNQVNPWGSVNYTQNGTNSFTDSMGKTVTVPQFTQTTTYTPEQQAIFDKSTAAQTNMADIASQQSASLKDYLGTKFNFTGAPDVSGMAGNPMQAGNAATDRVNGMAANPFQMDGSATDRVGNMAANPLSINNPAAGQVQNMASDPFAFSNQDAANWSYDLASQRILPQQQQAQRALETSLVNRGLRPGTAAWNSEMSRMGQQNSDQMNQLALTGRQQAFNEQLGTRGQNFNEAATASGQAYDQAMGQRAQQFGEATGAAALSQQQQLAQRQQQFNEASGAAGLTFQQQLAARQQAFNEATGARGQAFQEQAYERSAPINEITALLSGSQVANPGQMSSATPQASVAGVDYTGLVNQQYQAKLASSQAMMGGLFGLAGSLGSAGIMR